MGKQMLAHSYNGILLSNQKEQTRDTHSNMDEFLKNVLLNERSQIPKNILYDSIYMLF